MRFCWLLVFVWPLCASETWQAENEEEALFLRRIADFWQEGEYQIAKSQMEEFIVQYPESPFSDALCGALGDISLREKNFSSALSHYSQIQSSEFSDRVFLSRMQCLYEMQWYASLADECELYLEKKSDLHVTYFLAIALYHQCLNATKNPEALQILAERAKPYFETLSQSELSDEVAQGFAHLCCILKDFPKASRIYLDLAEKDLSNQEEMLFQAGLIQSEFDKPKALQTFEKIAALGQKRAKEAAYNRLVLSFDMGQHEELMQVALSELPADRIGMAHLFLGRSLLSLKKYPEAISEIKLYIETAPVSENYHAALLTLLDAAYQCSDLGALNLAIAKFGASYPQDAELPKAYFSRAQILKKNQNILEARSQIEELLAQFPEFQQKSQAIFELAHLDYAAKSWEQCYSRVQSFLVQFPEHELAPFAWRYFVSSSTEIAAEKPEFRERLITDLEIFLQLPLSEAERNEWQFILAKTEFELGHYEAAKNLLQNQQTPNALLLAALVQKEGFSDLPQFCELAELALSKGANLADPEQIHISLFNAYLQTGLIEKGAEHLYEAFERRADIKTENLLWLADVFYTRLMEEETNFPLADRTATILCKAALHLTEGAENEAVLCKLARVYAILGRLDDEIALLEKLENPTQEAQLLLAEGYMKKGKRAQATHLFDAIVAESSTVRSATSAAAALQGTRLKLTEKNPDLVQIATQFKNLVVQKNLMNEPIHLEAALDYIALQAHDSSKRLALLQKTKSDFESSDDLLSKDYHEARLKNPSKDKIYQGYMRWIDAEILSAQAELIQDPEQQKDLQAKAKDLLLQIVQEPTAQALFERAQTRLNDET
jgi:outer membrane protein assembly factor BamD (BamD/ComL family)